jgi:predicted transposase YbfD/YdcC
MMDKSNDGQKDVERTEVGGQEEVDVAVPEQSAIPKPVTHSQKVNKHDLAKTMLEASQTRIKSTDDEIEACLARIDEDINGFKQVESRFFNTTLQPSQKLLKELGAAERVLDSTPTPTVDLHDPDIQTVEIKPISSGRMNGFMLGLLGGVAALGGWCYTATQSLGLPLLPEKLPDVERWTQVLEWTSQKLGQGSNAVVGATAIVLALIAIIWVIYWLTKTITAGSNLKKAVRIEEDTEFYCSKKGECKGQMEKVREHIAHAKKTIEKYDVLLAEQNARLNRALYIEEVEKYDQLNAKTKEDVKTIKKLAAEVERFMETPMAEHGILSKEGIEILEEVNKAANDHVMALYQ